MANNTDLFSRPALHTIFLALVSQWCSSMRKRQDDIAVADMVADMAADMEVDKVADMASDKKR